MSFFLGLRMEKLVLMSPMGTYLVVSAIEVEVEGLSLLVRRRSKTCEIKRE